MKKDNKAIIVTSIIAGVILIIAILALTTLGSMNPYSKDSVTVQGSASVEATPNLIGIYFNIETSGETSSEAKDANNEIYGDLIFQLAVNGFGKDELQTQSFNIYPDYTWNNGVRKENGYKATHSLKLELSSEDFDMISEVIDAGVDSGAGISYINFELSQELQSQYKAEALGLASKDAKIKAEAVAEGFDKRVGKLVSVSVSDYGYYPYNLYTARSVVMGGGAYTDEDIALAKESVANITPSEQTVSASVSATYKLR